MGARDLALGDHFKSHELVYKVPEDEKEGEKEKKGEKRIFESHSRFRPAKKRCKPINGGFMHLLEAFKGRNIHI